MRAKWTVTVLTLTMASLAALAVPAVAESSYTISYFSYPGARYTRALDINDAGQIVGSYEDAGLRSHAFLYENGSFTTIDYPGAYGTYATGINNAGQIVGWANMNPAYQSFLYEAGSFTAVAFPAYTIPYGINDAGQIVGRTGYGVYHHGFQYDGSFTVLDYPGASVTEVLGNNDAGQAGRLLQHRYRELRIPLRQRQLHDGLLSRIRQRQRSLRHQRRRPVRGHSLRRLPFGLFCLGLRWRELRISRRRPALLRRGYGHQQRRSDRRAW